MQQIVHNNIDKLIETLQPQLDFLNVSLIMNTSCQGSNNLLRILGTHGFIHNKRLV